MEQRPIKIWRADELLEHEFPKIASWIEPWVLPRGGTLLMGGLAKVGKSFHLLEFCRALATGTPLYGHPLLQVPEPAKVLYVEAEVGEIGTQRRLRGIVAKQNRDLIHENLTVVAKEDTIRLRLDTPDGLRNFQDVLLRVLPNVLVLDPIAFMHGWDENSAQDISELFRQFEAMKSFGRSEGMSIVISHHFGKPPKENYDPMSEYNFRGSSKWKDAPDTLLTIQRFKEMDLPWAAWHTRMQWTVRHGEGVPDMVCVVQQHNDGRVHFLSERGPIRPLAIRPEQTPKTGKKPATPASQLGFPVSDVHK